MPHQAAAAGAQCGAGRELGGAGGATGHQQIRGVERRDGQNNGGQRQQDPEQFIVFAAQSLQTMTARQQLDTYLRRDWGPARRARRRRRFGRLQLPVQRGHLGLSPSARDARPQPPHDPGEEREIVIVKQTGLQHLVHRNPDVDRVTLKMALKIFGSDPDDGALGVEHSQLLTENGEVPSEALRP